MVAGKSEDTALGTAHGRFLESLPRKAIELRGAIALLTATPAAEGPREDMRRRLHTLYASAVVFRNEALGTAIKVGIDCLETARDEKRALNAADLQELARLVRSIPQLGSGSATSAANLPRVADAAEPSDVRESATFVVTRPEHPVPSALSTRRATNSSNVSEARPLVAIAQAPERLQTTTTRAPLLQRVLSVLVVCAPDDRESLRHLWASDCLEPVFVGSVREALESARDAVPDVVLADEALSIRGELTQAFRQDPLIDFVPVVLLASADPPSAAAAEARGSAREQNTAEARGQNTDQNTDADARLVRPFELHGLLQTLGRVTGTLVDVESALASLGSVTLREVADRVADEIRHGLWDAAEAGREERISLEEGAEVLAAAWAAIARVRSVVSRQSEGRVRFAAHGSRSTPALLAVGTESRGTSLARLAPPGNALQGRRILVADDDEAVVRFFADLLGQYAATVLLAQSGEEALLAARRERPDVVISDILMPGLDGFGLCRKFKRDPLLADVPIILLSWKEDLLSRMRELASGASGYLQKEAPGGQVLSAVLDTLKPRALLEEQLGGPGEVRGNLEGTGIVPLLRSVRRMRPDSRVTVRDAWNLFECELREGRLAQVTRTASDGSFVRGERALPHLLGASAGRFSVTLAQGTLKFAFEGSLDEVLLRGAQALGAELTAVSYPLLARVARVVFDEDAQAVLSQQTPASMRQVVDLLHAGDSPESLIQRGLVARSTLEAVLLDMARRGALRDVVGKDGEDLFAEARKARKAYDESVVPLLNSPLSLAPNAQSEPPDEDAPDDELQFELAPPPVVLVPPAVAPVVLPPPQPPPVVAPEPRVIVASASLPASPAPASLSPASPKASGVEDRPLPGRDSVTPVLASAAFEPAPRSLLKEVKPESFSPEESHQESAENRRSRSTLLAWVAALVALFAIAFFAERVLEPEASSDRLDAIGDPSGVEPAKAAAAVPSENAVAQAQDEGTGAKSNEANPARAKAQTAALVLPEDSGFQIYDAILEPTLVNSPEQGLLVVEASPELSGAALLVDQKPVGKLPAKVALSEGIHELAIEHGDATRYRFVSVRPGKTWVLRKP